MLKAFVAWLGILCLAMGNGAFREAALIPWLGKTPGLVLSGVLLSLLVLLVAWLFVRRLGGLALPRALLVGAFWLALTLAFEFGFGRFAQHKAWSDLLDAYTFKDGNLWPLVLAVTLLAPAIASRLTPGKPRMAA